LLNDFIASAVYNIFAQINNFKMEIKSIQKFNLINSISLISMSVWGYMDTNSFTALIPAAFGVILFILGTMLTNEKLVKLSAHLLVLFTLLILLALIIQVLPGVIDRGGVGLIRVILMISTSSLAMIIFIKSFIDNRKSR
tara:strand:- start:4455 stop:4874 length:420 start_codon:yes stop_codon:yes gene_type:complete